MEIHETIASFRAALDDVRRARATVGFVPTMGYLHDGHASLMRLASAGNDVAAASIFVNPLQFAADEDLASYPRDLDRDVALAAESGVTHVLAPDVEEMYPLPVLTTVSVEGITERFEGVARPTHFAGVATVVAKLFSIAGPCRAYFGEKDYQQLAVVRRMAADLSMPVEVVGCPTVREPDGLAMSSRNVYLTPEERAAAPVLHRALTEAADLVRAGERDKRVVEAALVAPIEAEPLAELDYAVVVDAATLADVDPLVGDLRLLLAGRFGRARLLDNCGVVAN